MEEINLPPFAHTLIESIRAIGYSLEAAISDVLDNSISADATDIEISYTPYQTPYIAMIDNGCGMDSEKLTESMRYGSCDSSLSRESSDMGRYGLGMKTASLSQCRHLTVISKKNGKISGRCWDLDRIQETGQWTLAVLDESEIAEIPHVEELQKLPSGTVVVWKNLDRIFSGEVNLEDGMTDKLNLVGKHLSLIFHRFLQGGDADCIINLTMNGEKVKGFDPFFTAKSRQAMDEEKIDIPQFHSVVKVIPYILPHPSKMSSKELEKYGGKDGMRSQQGFYIYRNKRLLIWGTWFRMTKMDEFSKLARVQVDIPNTLDDLWTLDVKKSTAAPPEIVKRRLKQILDQITTNSKRTYTFRGKRETRDDVTHVWTVSDTREGVCYELNNDHPLYEKLTEMMDDDAKKLFSEYVKTVANQFPIHRLHNDIFNEKKMASQSEDFKWVTTQKLLETYLSMAETEEEKEGILKKLIKADPFCEYIKQKFFIIPYQRTY